MLVNNQLKGLFKILTSIIIISLLFTGVGVGIGAENEEDTYDSSMNLSSAVEQYREYVTKKAIENDMEVYVDLILCIVEVESQGKGADVMNSSLTQYNKKYPKVPHGIQDPYYSIDCGIKQLKKVLRKSNVKSENDIENIKSALNNYHKNSDEEFSNKVLEYYNRRDEIITGKDDFLVPLKEYMVTSKFGKRGLDYFHYGFDIASKFGSNIYAPANGVVHAVSNICPPEGGFLGNRCPYNGISGGGNYVMLKVPYKGDDYYIFMCHMKQVAVKEGQTIKKGQKIGEQGNSGNSTGSHVHIEVHVNTAQISTMKGIIDPEKLFQFHK